MPSELKVLIVDDSPTIRKMVRASLLPLDLQLDEAGNGLEAIERLAVSHFDAMVLDMNMPDMHGLEVLKFVRSHQPYQLIPIVILTTRSDDTSRTTLMAAGASLYLTKPFVPQALAQEVRALLERQPGARSAAWVRKGNDV